MLQVNEDYISRNREKSIDVDLVRLDEAEADEMWSYVGKKSNQVWLWWILDHAYRQEGRPPQAAFA